MITRRFWAVVEWRDPPTGCMKYTAALCDDDSRNRVGVVIVRVYQSYTAASRVATQMQRNFEQWKYIVSRHEGVIA